MIARGRLLSIARVLRGAALALALAAPVAAAGQATQRAAVLFDAPSEKSRPLLILSEGFPLREISRVSGWTKVETFEGDSGWVRREKLIDRQACVVLRDGEAVRFDPNEKARTIFVARRGVTLDFLGARGAQWLQVLHPDGEAGFVAADGVWCAR